jgi:hypothetical protein
MRKILAAGMLAGAVAVIGAGTVHASNNDFAGSGHQGDHDASAYRVDITGFATGTVAEAGSVANGICTQLRSGVSEGRLVAAIADYQQSDVSDATYIVRGAEWHFCPSYYAAGITK